MYFQIVVTECKYVTEFSDLVRLMVYCSIIVGNMIFDFIKIALWHSFFNVIRAHQKFHYWAGTYRVNHILPTKMDK